MTKRYLGKSVLDGAKERIAWTFDNFDKIYLSFSGGKDSSAMIHLVMDECRRRNKKIGVLFIDWECQMTLTINFVEKIYNEYSDYIEPYWIALPMKTWNATSMYEPEWAAWDRDKKDLWARDPHPKSITDLNYFPFYYEGMPFEEFVPAFGQWYSNGEKCACFVGIRTQESLNRFRSLSREKPMFDGKKYTTNVVNSLWNVYPIYDWQTKDIWIYTGKERKSYNRLYDRMYQSGLSIHQMRICEPFGDEARKGLWLYQVIEPQMWAKVCLRVAGANTGSLYCNEKGSVYGNGYITLPQGHTYESFSKYILSTMPRKTAEHYRNKLAVYINWWTKRGYQDGIPETAPKELEASGKAPSWRKICKTLLRNDYWCRGLGFSPTKSNAYKKYCELMKKRRENWNIFKEELKNGSDE